MTDNDSKLVLETLNGNTEYFGMLVEKYQNKMFNLAFQITHDTDVAKDIVQESFIKAYNKLKSFDPGKKFFSWIYRITLNESLNYKKRRSLSGSIGEDTPNSADLEIIEFEKRETSIKIQKAIENLDNKYKTLIMLKHYQELSYKEIADIVNLPVGKVKSRLYIARENLRKSLEGINK